MAYDFQSDPMHQVYLKYAYEAAQQKSTDPELRMVLFLLTIHLV